MRQSIPIRGSRKGKEDASAQSDVNSISSPIIQALNLGPSQLLEGSLQEPAGRQSQPPVGSWSEPSSS